MELDKHILLRDYATAGKFSKKKNIEQIETSSWAYIYPCSYTHTHTISLSLLVPLSLSVPPLSCRPPPWYPYAVGGSALRGSRAGVRLWTEWLARIWLEEISSTATHHSQAHTHTYTWHKHTLAQIHAQETVSRVTCHRILNHPNMPLILKETRADSGQV